MDLKTASKWIRILAVSGFVILSLGCLIRLLAVVIIGILTAIAGIVVGVVYFRCPHCGKYPGNTMGTYCPHCGNPLEWK